MFNKCQNLWRETFDSSKYWFNSTIGTYRDLTQVERIKEKSDPHYGYSHLISMHAKRLGSKLNRAIVENNASDYYWEQA